MHYLNITYKYKGSIICDTGGRSPSGFFTRSVDQMMLPTAIYIPTAT